MKNILFLCTGNSCRSQMAEGWGKLLKGSHYHFYSAGTKKHGLNPYAIKVMKDVGVDISNHTSNTVDDFKDIHFDLIFTLCDDAHENCPYFKGGQIIHVGFDDPPRITSQMSNENEIFTVYKRVRDEIKEFIQNIEKYMENL